MQDNLKRCNLTLPPEHLPHPRKTYNLLYDLFKIQNNIALNGGFIQLVEIKIIILNYCIKINNVYQ